MIFFFALAFFLLAPPTAISLDYPFICSLPQLVILTLLGTADFDLTGQLVWPGAMLLNDYLSKNAEILQGCSILELGSGVGKQ